MLTMANMRVLVAVVEEGSFTGAAHRLNATQSGISQQIRKLEELLGTKLLRRLPTGAEVTPAGRELYTRCVAILRDASDAERAVGSFKKGVSGTIMVGVMPSMTRCVMGPVLRRLMCKHPNATVKVVEGLSAELISRVKADELELAIVPVFDAPEAIRCNTLGATAEVMVCRGVDHPEHMQPVDIASIAPLKLILSSSGNIRRQQVLAYLRSRQVEVGRLLELDSMFGTFEFIENSDFLTFLPAVMVLPEIERRTMCVRPLAGGDIKVEIMAIQSRRRPDTDLAGQLKAEIAAELAAVPAVIARHMQSPERMRKAVRKTPPENVDPS